MEMIKIKFRLLVFVLSVGVFAQAEESDSLGVIGDNLDLYAVMDAFKNSETVEAFETAINNPDNKINNLDLNEDGQVDYIKVIDNTEDDAHALILRIDLSETESQDVAVVELEKIGNETANIQIVGDEDLYGADYIIEPKEEEVKGKMPPAIIILNVWHWHSVRFIFGPKYKPWISPWGWRHHPHGWKPWKPYHWKAYHGFHKHHRHHYHVVHVHRIGHAHKIYHKHKKSWKHIKNHPHHHSHHKGNKGGIQKGNQHKGHKNGNNKGHKTNNKKNNNKGNSGGNKKNNGGGKKNTTPVKKGGGKKHR